MRARIAALLALVGVLVVTGVVDSFARRAYQAEVRGEVAATADSLAREISDVIARETAAVETLAAFVIIDEGDVERLAENFPTFAGALVNPGSSVRSVQLAPDSTLSLVFPIEGNEAAIGLDLLADPDRRALLEPSIASGSTTVQGPVGLVQGGLGIIVRQPVYLPDGSFWGFAAVVLDWTNLAGRTMLERSLLDTISGVRLPGTGQVIAGAEEAFDDDPLLREFSVGATDTRWQLASRPNDGWPTAADVTPAIWVAGAMVALVAAAFAFAAARRPELLRAEVARAVAELRESELRYRELFEAAPIGIQLEDYSEAIGLMRELDAGGVIDLREYLRENPEELRRLLESVTFEMNPTAALFQEGIGTADSPKTLLSVLNPDTEEGLIESLVGVLGGTQDAEWSIEAVGSDGRRRTLRMRWHLPEKEGRLPDYGNLLMTIMDVTALRRTEQRLERLVDAKDRFVSSVAHELRTPLTAVVGFARELNDSAGDLSSEELTELHGLVASYALELSHLVEDLLVSGRSDVSEVRVHPEEMDLSYVAGEAVMGLPNLSLTVEAPGGTVVAHADPIRVRQIVRNLVTNAFRHGGDDVRAAVLEVEGRAAVEVSDDGPALSPEDSELIFHPYERILSQTAKPGSIGLGLTVSRSLAHLQGGDLVLDRVGDRNVFRLTLPLAAVSAPVE